MNRALRKAQLDVLKRARKPLRPAEIIRRVFGSGQADERKKKQVHDILSYEARKADGFVIRQRGRYELRRRLEERLRRRVVEELRTNGFRVFNGELTPPLLRSKEDIRRFHAKARAEKYQEHRRFLEKTESKLIRYFADGKDVSIPDFWPRLEVVKPRTIESDLFRYATLLWSVPVSHGFGRRVRFLVWDDHTDKLVGLFALGDPVFNLSCRDNWIGWTHRDRAERLYNVMDIFILGAVPPFDILLGGKLVAMIAASNEVRGIIRERYSGKKTVLTGKRKDSILALLTTGSALGKSALYDRIRYDGRVLYKRIGASKGWGHFHLNNGLFGTLFRYLRATEGPESAGYKFGSGPNWKIRTARSALEHLHLSGNLLRHGVRREIYGIPLAENFAEFLRGETNVLESYNTPFDDIAAFWKERWLIGRAERKPEFLKFEKEKVGYLIHSASEVHGRSGGPSQWKRANPRFPTHGTPPGVDASTSARSRRRRATEH